MGETVDRLLDAAESAVRSRGYHGVSFRELADDVGIKSASVHYYFPQKEDLAVALIARYADAFFADLAGRVGSAAPSLKAYCDTYRDALVRSGRACLCGILGAESRSLPKPVADAVAGFFEANLAWIGRALPRDLVPADRRARSAYVLAALQGGMMVAATLGDHSLFDGVARRVLAEAMA